MRTRPPTSVWDDTNYGAGYGQYLAAPQPQLQRHCGLPWGFTLSVNSAIISTTPQTALVNSLKLPGTVPAGGTEPLPGLEYGCLGAGGCSKADLAKAIDNYNNNIVGTLDAQGKPITGKLALPDKYEFDEPSITQDFRLTKTFTIKERWKISILGEMFNAFNISNLSSISHTLDLATSTSQGLRPADPARQPDLRVGRAACGSGRRSHHLLISIVPIEHRMGRQQCWPILFLSSARLSHGMITLCEPTALCYWP